MVENKTTIITMLQYINSNSAMETRDHSKNGASPKSQTSRGNINKGICIRLSVILILFFMLTPFEHTFAQMKKPASDDVQKLFLKAVVANDVEKVKLFLQNGASANYYNADDSYWEEKSYGKSSYGNDPLMLAILNQAKDVASFLIQYDRMVLFPRAVNGKESFIEGPSRITRDITVIYTPLEIAIKTMKDGKTDIVQLILDETFHPTGGTSLMNDKIKNFTLKTDPITTAVQNNKVELNASKFIAPNFGLTFTKKKLL